MEVDAPRQDIGVGPLPAVTKVNEATTSQMMQAAGKKPTGTADSDAPSGDAGCSLLNECGIRTPGRKGRRGITSRWLERASRLTGFHIREGQCPGPADPPRLDEKPISRLRFVQRTQPTKGYEHEKSFSHDITHTVQSGTDCEGFVNVW